LCFLSDNPRVDYLTENTDEANVNKTIVDYLTENTDEARVNKTIVDYPVFSVK
jgi:hypothetical protein